MTVGRQTFVRKEEGRKRKIRERQDGSEPPESLAGEDVDADQDEKHQATHGDSIGGRRLAEEKEHSGDVVRLHGARIRGTVVENGMFTSLQDVLRHQADDRLIGAQGNALCRDEPPLVGDGKKEECGDPDALGASPVLGSAWGRGVNGKLGSRSLSRSLQRWTPRPRVPFRITMKSGGSPAVFISRSSRPVDSSNARAEISIGIGS